MNKKIKVSISALVLTLLVALSINAYAVFTPPTSNPGTGNVETPINSGDALQIKQGGLILGYLRVLGLTLLGGNLEVAGTVKIYGGNPGAGKVLVSDATGLASWVDPSTLGIGGGTVDSNNNDNNTNPPAPDQGIGGTGTAGSIPKFVNSTTLGNSIITELNGKIGINTPNPLETLHVTGNARISGLAGTGVRQVCVDPNGKLQACSGDVSRVITFSVRFDGTYNNLTPVVEQTRILYSNDPSDIGKKVKVCNFEGVSSDEYAKFKAHFDLPGNSCSASTGVNIDSSEIVSAQYLGGSRKYVGLNNADSGDKIEFAMTSYEGNSGTGGTFFGGTAISNPDPGDKIYFIVEWPSVAN
jgi:hypothetical protein